MANKVKLFADSCVDLSSELKKEFDVGEVSLYVVLGEESRRDVTEIKPEELYAYYDATGKTPGTAAPSIADFTDAWRPFILDGCDIVYVGLSSEISATVNNARLAAEEFPEGRVRVVDSLNLSTGIGLLVAEAARLRDAGKTAAEIAEALEEKRKFVRASFVINDLKYLYAGGRCSAVSAYFAAILSIKPEILVENGGMRPNARYKGSFKKVAERYCRAQIEDTRRKDGALVFVTDSHGTDPAVAESLMAMLRESGQFERVCYTKAQGVITGHCGPGCIGVLYCYAE